MSIGNVSPDASIRAIYKMGSQKVLGTPAVLALGQGRRHLINWTSGRMPTVEYFDSAGPSMVIVRFGVSCL